MSNSQSMQAPLNYEVFREVEEDVAAGISEIMIDLIDTYVEDSQKHMQKIGDQLDAEDVQGLVLAAHSLKSSSATFGAESLAALFARMEERARQQDLEQYANILAQARQEYAEVRKALETERDRLAQR